MIKITSNIGLVTKMLSFKLKEATSPNGVLKDKYIRAVASSIGGDIKIRVHQQGIKSDGGKIGTYSSQYLRLRQKKYNRTSSPDIILSLTRQQENDFSIVASDPIKTSTGYGLGFKSDATYMPKPSKRKVKGQARAISNAQKAEWQKQEYGDIYKPTNNERVKIKMLYESLADEFIKSL